MTILTLAEAKLGLNKTAVTDDVELQSFIDATTSAVEFYIGPVDSRAITETTRDCDYDVLPLRLTPVISVATITSIYVGGPAFVTADLHVDTAGGFVRRLDRADFTDGPFTVVYTAGRATVPAAVNMAARFIVAHLWTTQRGASRRPAAGGDDTVTLPGWGFAIPNRAAELLEPFALVGGVA